MPARAKVKTSPYQPFIDALQKKQGELLDSFERDKAAGNAQPDDGILNVGVVTASGAVDWVRTLGRSVVGDAEGSPFVETTTGREFDIRLNKAIPYEIDGGDRKKAKRLRCTVVPEAITVCVPQEEAP